MVKRVVARNQKKGCHKKGGFMEQGRNMSTTSKAVKGYSGFGGVSIQETHHKRKTTQKLRRVGERGVVMDRRKYIAVEGGYPEAEKEKKGQLEREN